MLERIKNIRDINPYASGAMLIICKKGFDLQGYLLNTNILKFIITYRMWLQVR